jgi:hypothetical protein
VTTHEASDFARENGLMYIETSAKTNKNVEEAFLECSRSKSFRCLVLVMLLVLDLVLFRIWFWFWLWFWLKFGIDLVLVFGLILGLIRLGFGFCIRF